MLVRSFHLSDYVKITELLDQVLDGNTLEDTMAALACQINWDSSLVLVAVEDGEVLGVMIGTTQRNQGYYYRIAVHPDHQRRGIGSALIQSMKLRFQQRQIARIMVPVDEYNEQLLPIYEKAGCCREDFNRTFGKLSILVGS
jgi:ribosomal protein S18 acetylase RimI-like enzyme